MDGNRTVHHWIDFEMEDGELIESLERVEKLYLASISVCPISCRLGFKQAS